MGMTWPGILLHVLVGCCPQEPLPLGPYDSLSTGLLSHGAAVHAAAMPPGGGIVLSLDAAGTITGWNRRTGRRLYSRPLLPAADLPQRITCSPDGKWVAFSSPAMPPT